MSFSGCCANFWRISFWVENLLRAKLSKRFEASNSFTTVGTSESYARTQSGRKFMLASERSNDFAGSKFLLKIKFSQTDVATGECLVHHHGHDMPYRCTFLVLINFSSCSPAWAAPQQRSNLKACYWTCWCLISMSSLSLVLYTCQLHSLSVLALLLARQCEHWKNCKTGESGPCILLWKKSHPAHPCTVIHLTGIRLHPQRNFRGTM